MTATRNLTMIRGDTLSFDVRFSDLNGATIRDIYFTAKKRAMDAEYIFQKSLYDGITLKHGATYRVRVAPEDTITVMVGKYVYDLRIGIGDDVYTLLTGTLVIEQDVTMEV